MEIFSKYVYIKCKSNTQKKKLPSICFHWIELHVYMEKYSFLNDHLFVMKTNQISLSLFAYIGSVICLSEISFYKKQNI